MAIEVTLDLVLVQRKMSLTELSERILDEHRRLLVLRLGVLNRQFDGERSHAGGNGRVWR